jgi:tRNA modification GTPase
MSSTSKTIYALASAAGRAGVAVFRISGAASGNVIEKLCRPNQMPEPRTASLRALHHPTTGEKIDLALILYFAAPHSFTGEDVVEIHAHGGRAVTSALIEALQSLPNFRLAEPGEFTRRAFETGKLDLTEAEAIADLVDAETEAQRRQALRQMDGALGKLYEDWRQRLAHVLAYLEAAIDFADEDLPGDVSQKQLTTIRALSDEISTHLNDGHRGERLRDGFSIAILGAPNAGKSSLLNALARREAAIVSSIAGTTRDVIEVHLDLGGYPVTLADTAGLRNSADVIETEGVRRALQRAEYADLKLLVFDGSAWPDRDVATMALMDDDAIMVVNKTDVLRGQKPNNEAALVYVSALTGTGLAELMQRLTDKIKKRFVDNAAPALTRTRHRTALEECVEHLQRSLAAQASELRAEDVRLAMRTLGRITGRVDVEDLLDIIFRDFCIGK